MEELINQLTAVARGMWKFRWLGLIVAWMVAIAGAVVTFRIPDRYEAMARIYVDTQSILKPLMAGLAVQPNVSQQVTMLSRTLISRPNIEKLVRMADLDLKSESKAQQEALIESLMERVKIGSTGRDNLYALSFADPDREKARRVIQSMVSIFVESSLGASRKDADSAKVFLDEQIKNYEAKLEEAETRLKEFRIRNIDLQLGDGRDSTSRLGDISQALEKAKLDLKEAENARDQAKKQVEEERTRPTGATTVANPFAAGPANINVSTPEIDARLDAQRRSLDVLLQRFTEAHPDVVNARRLIKDLEEQKVREMAERKAAATKAASEAAAAAAAAAASAGPAPSPVLQELTRVLAAAEVQVASLRARVAEYQSRMATARDKLRTAPQIEAEQAQLNRDYAIIKRNYEDLVGRRQSAAMSGDLDMASGIVDFRLIDPPRVSPKPVSPNRLLLMPLVLAIALAAGLVTTFVANQLRPVYHDAQELRAKAGVPLLGVVSVVLGPEEQRRERMNQLRFYAGTVGLFGAFLVAMITISIMSTRQVG